MNSQANTSTFTGTWGGDSPDPSNALTVGEVSDWLQQPPAADYPYFYLDLAEPGATCLLQFTGHVYLTDENGDAIDGADWAFDNLLQPGIGDYDSTAWVSASRIPIAGTGQSGGIAPASVPKNNPRRGGSVPRSFYFRGCPLIIFDCRLSLHRAELAAVKTSRKNKITT